MVRNKTQRKLGLKKYALKLARQSVRRKQLRNSPKHKLAFALSESKYRSRVRGHKPCTNAPPPPVNSICACCASRNSLRLDHDHETGKFRGWICYACNRGIGELGDDLAGVRQAATYLERAMGASQ